MKANKILFVSNLFFLFLSLYSSYSRGRSVFLIFSLAFLLNAINAKRAINKSKNENKKVNKKENVKRGR
ncbi:MAG: hypothetical protein ACLVEW_07095 [Peptoniphilus sp.]|uniref:hypothetical protein n=1 Tax=Peptoniphilus sp. TaxID=1971214 RepID=UPI0029022243|nr:hypothetical protein [Peptoniphilus harei]MDU5184829.1 hypothetical protein [Peptoniphilus harei]